MFRKAAAGVCCAALLLMAMAPALPAQGQPAGAPDHCVLAPADNRGARPIPEIVSAEIFDALVGWIALNTSYDLRQIYHAPPVVSFCSIGDLVDYEDTRLLVEPGLEAAYDLPNRHIYLVLPWSAQDLFDRSLLLHEMIHDVQLANRSWACIGAPEFEAYLLQDKWLRQHGIHHPFNWGAILRLSACP